MAFFSNIRTAFIRYKDFSGTSDRQSFWAFTFFRFIVAYILLIPGIYLLLKQIVDEVRSGRHSDKLSNAAPFATVLCSLAITFILFCAVPYLALRVRRLRSAGLSPWLVMIWLLPILGPTIVLILCNKKEQVHIPYIPKEKNE